MFMAGSISITPDQPSGSGAGIERAIRFAVYLTGGLVTLAFGLLYITSDLGEVLNCVYQTDICSGGFSQGLYLETIPQLVGGAIMLVVAIVLLLLARRTR